jgi:plastocyanin
MKRIYTLIILSVTALLLISAGIAAVEPSPSPAAVKEVNVTIASFAFAPAEITIAPGTKVTWTNNDSMRHNTVFETFKGPLLAKGESWSTVFDKTGTYAYYCGPHPWMKATVIVK